MKIGSVKTASETTHILNSYLPMSESPVFKKISSGKSDV